MVHTARERVSGLRGLCWATEAGVDTFGPMEPGCTPGASKRTVTCVGVLSCPGATRAKLSRRLCGFSTMPTSLRSVPPWCQGSPSLKPNVRGEPGCHGHLTGSAR